MNKTPKENRIAGSSLRLALALLCAVSISMSALCFTYAKYTTQASASDSARVAKFDIEMLGKGTATDPFALETLDGIIDTPSAIYLFSVTSKSEVSATADLTLTVGDSKVMPTCVAIELYDVTDTELTEASTVLGADFPTTGAVRVDNNYEEEEGPDGEGIVSCTFNEFAEFASAAETGDKKVFALRFVAGPHGSIKESANLNLNLSVTVSQKQ